MRFPIWQYLNQRLWDKNHPLLLNPAKYWQHHQRLFLSECLHNSFLESCWETDYQAFVVEYHDFCDRRPQEEDPRWLAERCWDSEWGMRAYEHPENQVSETEC